MVLHNIRLSAARDKSVRLRLDNKAADAPDLGLSTNQDLWDERCIQLLFDGIRKEHAEWPVFFFLSGRNLRL